MLHIQDAEWTKDETDYLFSLMREYDGRFFVVHDRYEYPNGPERTIEVRNRRCQLDWFDCHRCYFRNLTDVCDFFNASLSSLSPKEGKMNGISEAARLLHPLTVSFS